MTVTASSGTGARFIFDTKHDIVPFLYHVFLVNNQRKGEESFGTPFLVLLLDARLSLNCFSSFIHNESKTSHRDLLLLKHFRQHRRFNACTIDEQCNHGVMKIYHRLKRWWLFHELTQPNSWMPLVVFKKGRRIIWDSLSGALIGRQGLSKEEGWMGLEECVATKWIALSECLVYVGYGFLLDCRRGKKRIIWDSLSGALIGRQRLGRGWMGLAEEWIALSESLIKGEDSFGTPLSRALIGRQGLGNGGMVGGPRMCSYQVDSLSGCLVYVGVWFSIGH
ncbi:hypothetical protein CEXT_543071 [Caerostris extrusa]|uniref:Maturase K n=1 Tax=Caerostris extrusa TaxID=172846 RepID=A0AAV4Q2C6_CAEEX|nr:hypothetical protein CEXT_543071 [Caerostris extrusa]